MVSRSGPTRDGCRTTHVGPDQTAESNQGVAKSRVTTIRGENPVGWQRAFDDPIDLPRGRRLVMLQGRQDFSSANRLFERRDQFAHMIVDLGQCDRRMDKLNVVDMPIGNPVGYAGKPPLDQWAVLGLFKGNH
jgi:hypothetical protein